MHHTHPEISGPVSYEEGPILETETKSISRPRLWIHALLFFATILTTLLAGAIQQGVDPIRTPWALIQGIPFSFTLLAILFTHEMGHYLTSRWHRVDASLPYFIPAPPFFPLPIGTFGAFIRMRSPIMDKRALLDIGASGPIAGFVVSLVAVALGLQYSQVVEAEGLIGIGLGTPLIFQFISYLVIGPVGEGFDVLLHPVAFAGWIGLFITALNLIPIGQLDGGHVVYAILGKRHRTVSMAMIPILVMMGYWGWPGWYLWAFLSFIIGIGHPPTMNPHEELDTTRKLIGWTSLAMFILCFTPVPFYIQQ